MMRSFHLKTEALPVKTWFYISIKQTLFFILHKINSNLNCSYLNVFNMSNLYLIVFKDVCPEFCNFSFLFVLRAEHLNFGNRKMFEKV